MRLRPVSRESAGHVLAVVLMALVVLLTAALMTARAVDTTLAQQRREVRVARLQALVDAGLAFALAELSRSSTWPGTIEPLPLADGTYEVDVTSAGGFRLDVVVTARLGPYGRRAEALVSILDEGKPRVIDWTAKTLTPGSPSASLPRRGG